MTLERLSLNQMNNPISMFVNDSNYYELDTEYQRGHVWSTERQRALIKSLMMNLPTGAIVTNNRGLYSEKFNINFGTDKLVAVVDGKQRITAVREFMNDNVPVPGSWFLDDHDDSHVVWSDLPKPVQRNFKLRSFSVCEASVDSIEKEKELFDLINFGGVDQGDSDFE